MNKMIEESEIEEILSQNGIQKDWTYTNGFLHAEYQFKNFREAWQFMTEIALEAEKMDHHPNWSNVYSKVIINLNTHSAGGVTELDIELAKIISLNYQSEHFKTLSIFKF